MLDKIVPKKKESATLDGIKRVLFDRFVFAPPFILFFLYTVTLLEVSINLIIYKMYQING